MLVSDDAPRGREPVSSPPPERRGGSKATDDASKGGRAARGTGRAARALAGGVARSSTRGTGAFLRGVGAASWTERLVLALGMAAAVLLVAAELTPLYAIDVAGASCDVVAEPALRDQCVTTGGNAHSYGFLLLALLALAMTFGAAFGGSAPAGAALCTLGVVVLAISLGRDLPAARSTGEIGVQFLQANASIAVGLWFELAAGLLAIAAGVVRLRWRRPREERA